MHVGGHNIIYILASNLERQITKNTYKRFKIRFVCGESFAFKYFTIAFAVFCQKS